MMPEASNAMAELLGSEVRVVNIGLAGFAHELERCGVAVVQVDWSPPAGGDAHLIALLDRLRR
jgi:FdrA protein